MKDKVCDKEQRIRAILKEISELSVAATLAGECTMGGEFFLSEEEAESNLKDGIGKAVKELLSMRS